MSRSLRVLFVEDSAEETALLVRQLRRGGYDPTFVRVDSADALDAALCEQTWDIILAEYTLSRFRPPAALNQLKERQFRRGGQSFIEREVTSADEREPGHAGRHA